MTHFWTSDLHLGHANIIEYCPDRQALTGVAVTLDEADNEAFLVEAMNEALIRNWNETVGPDDEVTIVGDLAMGKIDQSLALVQRLNGSKALIPGNHDRCWAHFHGNQKKDWKQIYRDAGLTLLPEQMTLMVGGHEVLVCHFPYRGDSQDQDRYLYARPFDEGKILLCGHVHDSWLSEGRQINVGQDVWDYRPVPDSEIVHLIEEIEAGR